MKNKFFEIDVNEIKPYKKNAKKHPEEQIKKIMASIEEFGIVNPIIIDKDKNIIAGHGRLEAIKRLGINKVPVLMTKHLTKTQIKAYRLADNKLAELGEWDDELLTIELRDLLDQNFDIEMLGFDESELEDFIEADMYSQEKENDIPDIEEKIVIKKSDLIELGVHKIFCGDSLALDTFSFLNIKNINLLILDPLFNMDYSKINIKDAKVIAIFSRGGGVFGFLDSLYKSGYGYHNIVNLGPAHGVAEETLPANTHEIIHIFRKKKIFNNKDVINLTYGGEDRIKATSVLKYGRPTLGEYYYKYAKPIGVLDFLILAYSNPDDIVCDFFAGSGTTLISAEKNNRISINIEIEPKFCQLIINRWTNYTGNDEIKINGKTVKWSEYKLK